MIVPVVFDYENNGLKFILLKYLRFLDLCMKEKWPVIITHEEFEKYEIEFADRKELEEEMQKKYEYRLYSYEQRMHIKHYFFPSSTIQKIEEERGSKLGRAIHFLKERDPELEKQLRSFFADIKKEFDEEIEAVLYFAACPLSLTCVCEEMGVKTVAYETGPIRKDSYRCNTSYFCRNGLYNTIEIGKRWDAFQREMDTRAVVPVFRREEILEMFLGKPYLGYLSHLNETPQYEMGIAGGCALVVPYFASCQYMDHELIDDIFNLYRYNEVLVRLHPGDVYTAKYRLRNMECSESPFPFLLNVKRVSAVGSNVLFEAMLWKRIACSKTNVMPATLFCSSDYREKKENELVELFVNFFVFAFLSPMELAFDTEYIKWRLSNPSESEIYLCHLEYYLRRFGLNKLWERQRPEIRIAYLNYYRDNEEHEKQIEKSILSLQETDKEENYYLKYVETRDWLERVLNSTSWKITKPIRLLLDKIRALQ